MWGQFIPARCRPPCCPRPALQENPATSPPPAGAPSPPCSVSSSTASAWQPPPPPQSPEPMLRHNPFLQIISQQDGRCGAPPGSSRLASRLPWSRVVAPFPERNGRPDPYRTVGI